MEERAGGVEELEPLLLHASKDDIFQGLKYNILQGGNNCTIKGSHLKKKIKKKKTV